LRRETLRVSLSRRKKRRKPRTLNAIERPGLFGKKRRILAPLVGETIVNLLQIVSGVYGIGNTTV
jgi:hypothetical protein